MLNLVVLIGESASGKSSIERNLVEKHGYNRIISYTTRKPRQGEHDGIDYHFITEETFLKLKEQDFFAETAVYNGWYYGSAKDDCTDDKVAVMNPHGLRQLKKIDGINVTSFYINVPRRDRLIKILQRGDDIEEAYRRSVHDDGQFAGIEDECDYVVPNPDYRYDIDTMTDTVLYLLGK